MKKILAVTAAIIILSPAAYAADAIIAYDQVPATQSASVFNWTGAYIGGQVGYGFGSADYTYLPDQTWASFYDYSNDPDGYFGGLYVGYNHQFSNSTVLGVDADIAWANLKDTDFAPGDPDFFATTKINRTGAARLRLGYAFDRFMPYIAGGVAFAKLNFDDYQLSTNVQDGSARKNLTGWTIGAGAEYALTDQWIMRGEYRYTDFGKTTFSATQADSYSGKLKIHDIRLGIAYKF